MSKVKLGLIVNYKTTEQDQKSMSEHSRVCNVQEELPAVVVKVWGPECVNLKVFHDGQGDTWVTSSLQGDTPGSWNFLPEEKKEKKAKEDTAQDPPAGDPPAAE